ncbi:hypothetical protein GTO27_00765, partial [Candidatus Bathyarchaeota archaeon]|nr:hypothetical protein [Candidatus Bathyarchaeota archaeon]
MRKVVGFVVILILVLMTFPVWDIQRAEGETITVPDDYPTIAGAVDAASDGDTVYVRSGTYNDALIITKPISLIGQNKMTTKLVWERSGGLSIWANNVVVEGFTFEARRNYSLPPLQGIPGTELVGIFADNTIFKNNIVRGIADYVWEGGLGMVGWWLWGLKISCQSAPYCSNNLVENNQFLDLAQAAVHLDYSSTDNVVRRNLIDNTWYGVKIGGEQSGFFENMSWPRSNTVEDNTITRTMPIQYDENDPGWPMPPGPPAGLTLWWNARDNLVFDNSVSECICGISVALHSDGNLLYNNVIESNGRRGLIDETVDEGYDVWVGADSIGNVLYHNFFGNHSMIYSKGGNVWDNGYPSGGNYYWKDYEGVDVKKGPDQDQPGSDGIGDAAVAIFDSSDQDCYPLMYPYGSPAPTMYTLSISSAANGSTNPAPGNYSYLEGQDVPVQALPDTGYVPDHWVLDSVDVGGGSQIFVSMEQDHILHPVFSWIGIQELNITTTAGGTTNPAPGVHIYTSGAVVAVTALSDIGYVFDHWELDSVNSGTAGSVNVTMDINHTLHAVFIPTYSLTITATAGGTTDPTPGTYTYVIGTLINITAIPDAGQDYYFDHWELDGANSTSNPVNMTMDTDHTLHAVFTLRSYTLITAVSSGGTLNPPPGTRVYWSGTRVNITAIPDPGYYLDHWELDGTVIGYVSTNPAVVDMTTNHTLHVTFAQLSSGHDVTVK